ncbi:apolipoprotein N-acyltransferase [Pedobacter glucosidilyticus]|uniref:apolipoprotein N-acyltransferase n=1 Tax=Pedobacter glucosidilyticus TaxID=1122941 RepID=UPI000413F4EC|nr:apolipoprotein N-acyltransferase [Pedobacter glucosidilyticus]
MKKHIQYALISALILFIAWPPIPYTSLLLLIGFFPLLVAIENIHNSDAQQKGRKVFLTAGLSFLLWNTASIYWIWNASPEGSIVAYLLGALLMTLSFLCYHKLKNITKPILADIALIGFWVSYEYLHQSWDLNFPWMTLGNGFASSPQFIQWYEYTGVYGGSLWILGSNILLFNIWKQLKNSEKQQKNIFKLLVGLACWVLIPIGFSTLSYINYEEENNPAHVVVVQPNIDPYAKYESYTTNQQLDTLMALSGKAAKVNTEFIIWPETAIPEYVNEDYIRQGSIFYRLQQFMQPYANATLITGAETYLTYQSPKTKTAKFNAQSNQYWDSFNTAVAIENSAKVQFYHKSKLVPGVEKMPFINALSFLKPVFAKFGGTTGGYGYQDEPSVLYSQSGIGVAPVICYESIWGNWVAGYVKKEAQFIAIITNDGWWGNTSGKDQHLQYARLRAVETRRWIARSANTGISAFINQRGDIIQQTSWWQPAVIAQDINLNSELTFYVKHPDIVVYPFLGIGILGLIFLLTYKIRNKAVKPDV